MRREYGQTHEEFNRFVQKVQSECMSWGCEYAIRPEGTRAYHSVYWDGAWHNIASEKPFTTDRDSWVDDERWSQIQYRMALSLATS